jgi:hypothetical protein
VTETERNPRAPEGGEFLLFVSDDGLAKLEVRLTGETLWLTQKQMAELFQKDVRTINEHIKNVYDEGELPQEPTLRNFRIVQTEGAREVGRDVAHYNLDVIISVGYRVKSHRGTQFRIWATRQLREFLIKGFVLDDERLKRAGQGNYFDELLARIRDIRSSEKMFWRKVLDIYATSIDYDPKTEGSQTFFATVQNKIHWAAHGHTAAEIVLQRADATKPQMGMTATAGNKPTKAEAAVAKNYLEADELETLNRIVNLYLEFAELQALGRKPMYMADWIAKLDDFLRVSDREILTGSGKVSHEAALKHVQQEYDKYRKAILEARSPVEDHFDAAVQHIKALDRSRPAPRKKKGE